MAQADPPELVIFDCDGVLIDSEPISISVLVDMVARAGGGIDESRAYDLFLGKSLSSIRRVLRDELGLAIADAHLDAMRLTLYKRFEEELRPIGGIHDALDRIGTRICVASSSQIERIAVSLRLTGLIDRFEPHVFSAQMVENGKPSPDLFLFAARAMGVEPARCLVVEDSLAGIAAARAAGMRVFGFAGGSHARREGYREALEAAGPERVFETMQDLPRLLRAE